MTTALALGQQAMLPDGGAGVVIRSTTALVQVRVAAEDSHGRPITDLQKVDFTVEDDRKSQPIAIFVADRGTPPRQAGTSSVVKPASPPEPTAGYALLVLDWLNTKYADRIQAQDAVLKLLKTFTPGQKVALYVLSSKPGLVADFIDDMDIIAQLVRNVDLDPSDQGDVTPARFDARYGGPQAAATAAALNRQVLIFDWSRKVSDSFRALEGLVGHLARMPGRKSLIWISAGFPITLDGGVLPGSNVIEVSYRPRFEKLINGLNRADVAVYSVDARGLSISSRGFLGTLKEVAERTGGTAFYNRNDLDEGIRLALEDQRVGYTLAYRLPDHEINGIHEIRVRVKRQGVRLRYRESYQLLDFVR